MKRYASIGDVTFVVIGKLATDGAQIRTQFIYQEKQSDMTWSISKKDIQGLAVQLKWIPYAHQLSVMGRIRLHANIVGPGLYGFYLEQQNTDYLYGTSVYLDPQNCENGTHDQLIWADTWDNASIVCIGELHASQALVRSSILDVAAFVATNRLREKYTEDALYTEFVSEPRSPPVAGSMVTGNSELETMINAKEAGQYTVCAQLEEGTPFKCAPIIQADQACVFKASYPEFHKGSRFIVIAKLEKDGQAVRGRLCDTSRMNGVYWLGLSRFEIKMEWLNSLGISKHGSYTLYTEVAEPGYYIWYRLRNVADLEFAGSWEIVQQQLTDKFSRIPVTGQSNDSVVVFGRLYNGSRWRTHLVNVGEKVDMIVQRVELPHQHICPVCYAETENGDVVVRVCNNAGVSEGDADMGHWMCCHCGLSLLKPECPLCRDNGTRVAGKAILARNKNKQVDRGCVLC